MSTPKKPLSYSAYSEYVTCPKKYELHRIQKIDPVATTNALLFGSAVDKALNEVLLGKKDKDAIQAAQTELGRLFTEHVNLEPSDYDGELITPGTEKLLLLKLKENGWDGQNHNFLAKRLFDDRTMGVQLEPEQQKQLNILVYFSFLEKIILIIQAFRDYFLPQVAEIVSVQKNVKRGILDFEVRLKGHDGIIVGDNKTASKDYDESAVRTSIQLAGYGAKKACYVVFNKTVRKNKTKICPRCGQNGTGTRYKSCYNMVENQLNPGEVRCSGEWVETVTPEIIPQIIIDDIAEETREMVEQAYRDVEKQIEAGVFPRNLTACGKQFGRPCEYINLCWNNDMKGLKKREET